MSIEHRMGQTIQANQPVAGAKQRHRGPVPKLSTFSHVSRSTGSRTLEAFFHPAVSRTLQEAYTALMSRAPGAAFRRARSLYLNKYPLPQQDQNSSMRLFVGQEHCEELEQPAPDGVAHHRLVTLTCRPRELALVHWQQTDAADPSLISAYLRDTWGLDADALQLQDFDEPWFRNGGHQLRFTPPETLMDQQTTLLTLKE